MRIYLMLDNNMQVLSKTVLLIETELTITLTEQ